MVLFLPGSINSYLYSVAFSHLPFPQFTVQAATPKPAWKEFCVTMLNFLNTNQFLFTHLIIWHANWVETFYFEGCFRKLAFRKNFLDCSRYRKQKRGRAPADLQVTSTRCGRELQGDSRIEFKRDGLVCICCFDGKAKSPWPGIGQGVSGL